MLLYFFFPTVSKPRTSAGIGRKYVLLNITWAFDVLGEEKSNHVLMYNIMFSPLLISVVWLSGSYGLTLTNSHECAEPSSSNI